MAEQARRCRCKTELVDGGREVVVSLSINWGDDDVRADWAGEKVFCSFGCVDAWLEEMVAKHDERGAA